MKNLIFGFVLIAITGLTSELVAQKTKSLASRRATKLEATLNSDVAKLRKTVDEKIAKLESEYTELVPHNGGILVLGYSRSKRRHPYKTLPNHVGFVTRTN